MEKSSISNLNDLIIKRLVVVVVTLLLAMPVMTGKTVKGSNTPS
jgi:hypothetical protein